MVKPPPRRNRRTLHLARSLTEACLGAASPEGAAPGFMVSVYGPPDARSAKSAEVTPFGPVVRTHEDADPRTLRSLVLDTLETGLKDVWLSCPSKDAADALAEEARILGHAVSRPAGDVPAAVPDPYAAFQRRRDLGGADSSPKLTFCKVDVEGRDPLPVGYTLAMACGPDGRGGTEVWYADPVGGRIATHGTIPRALSPGEQARIRATQPSVTEMNLGRGWKDGRVAAYQILVFRVPGEVAAILADARLDEPWGGRPGAPPDAACPLSGPGPAAGGCGGAAAVVAVEEILG